ncbi:hypothetical protein [Actinomadura roseirufa]|uniref:hypothetical protein n=1 Tax=Actinomadura roseirufa TaxID=2094049 RepID=UPI0010417AB1|nr:hypothetical protein [Actinomadura roseirufa]
MLRLHDHRTGRPEGLPGGRVLRVHVLERAGLRTLVVADLLRRVAERAGRHVQLAASPYFSAPDDHWTDYNIQPFEVLAPEGPAPEADLYLSSGAQPGVDAPCLAVPYETGDWYSLMANASMDALYARLALLEVRYRESLHLSHQRFLEAAARLDRWRDLVAGWATSPGRPLDRGYADRAETALANDLDTPSALAVLDDLADDDGVPPGAKLETVIHLDLLLGLGLVAALGRA